MLIVIENIITLRPGFGICTVGEAKCRCLKVLMTFLRQTQPGQSRVLPPVLNRKHWQVSGSEATTTTTGRKVKHSPPLLAASTASAGKPNWFIRGPSCPEARALLNMLIACRQKLIRESTQKWQIYIELLQEVAALQNVRRGKCQDVRIALREVFVCFISDLSLPVETAVSWVCCWAPRSSGAAILRRAGKASASAAPRGWPGWGPSPRGSARWSGPLQGGDKAQQRQLHLTGKLQQFAVEKGVAASHGHKLQLGSILGLFGIELIICWTASRDAPLFYTISRVHCSLLIVLNLHFIVTV